jgi:hypothetical protein
MTSSHATPPPVVHPAPAPPRTSGLALASLLCGIGGLFTCGLSAIIGLVLGIVALTRANRNGAPGRHRGTALAGVIVSAVMIFAGPAIDLPLLGLLIFFRHEAKDWTNEVWEKARDTPASPGDDYFRERLPWPRPPQIIGPSARQATEAPMRLGGNAFDKGGKRWVPAHVGNTFQRGRMPRRPSWH